MNFKKNWKETAEHNISNTPAPWFCFWLVNFNQGQSSSQFPLLIGKRWEKTPRKIQPDNKRMGEGARSSLSLLSTRFWAPSQLCRPAPLPAFMPLWFLFALLFFPIWGRGWKRKEIFHPSLFIFTEGCWAQTCKEQGKATSPWARKVSNLNKQNPRGWKMVSDLLPF